MNRDVFLSILAIDSYDRGYNQGVKGLSNSGDIGITVTRAIGITVTRAITPLLSGGTVKLIPTHTQFSYIRLTC